MNSAQIARRISAAVGKTVSNQWVSGLWAELHGEPAGTGNHITYTKREAELIILYSVEYHQKHGRPPIREWLESRGESMPRRSRQMVARSRAVVTAKRQPVATSGGKYDREIAQLQAEIRQLREIVEARPTDRATIKALPAPSTARRQIKATIDRWMAGRARVISYRETWMEIHGRVLHAVGGASQSWYGHQIEGESMLSWYEANDMLDVLRELLPGILTTMDKLYPLPPPPSPSIVGETQQELGL